VVLSAKWEVTVIGGRAAVSSLHLQPARLSSVVVVKDYSSVSELSVTVANT
jgi:hypothetical protein